MLRLASIALIIGAVLSASCVCALACCCDLMPGHSGSSDDHHCKGLVHNSHVNVDWMNFDEELAIAMRAQEFVSTEIHLIVPTVDLAVLSPPPQA